MYLIAGILVAALASLPPLTDAQRAQMDTADDALGQWDTAALYPLLTNAVTWGDTDPAALLPGAIIADYEALRAQPAFYRGQIVIIEGQFREERKQQLLRPGPWGETVTRWVVQVGSGIDDVAVIYLTDALPPPDLGAKVRVQARFYKLWPARAADGEPVTYVTFVGHSAAVLDAPAPRRRDATSGGGSGPRLGVMVTVALVVGALFFMLRRMTRLSLTPRPLPSQLRRQHDTEGRDSRHEPADDESDGEDGPPLPENPADALAELERRHHAQVH